MRPRGTEMLFSQIHYFRFHNVFRRISWHHYFLPDAGGGRMEHKRFPKERVQLGKAIPGCRIWGAQLGFSGFKELLVSADFLICNLIAFDQAREHDKPNRDREQRGEGGGINDGGGGGEGVAQASLPQRDIVR